MPKNKFKAALEEAKKKLQKAESDLQRFEQKSANLRLQIPRLRGSVQALELLCGGKRYDAQSNGRNRDLHLPVGASDSAPVLPPDGRDTQDKMTPAQALEMAKRGQDLSGVGSFRPDPGSSVPVSEPTSEDDTLPPIDGEEIL